MFSPQLTPTPPVRPSRARNSVPPTAQSFEASRRSSQRAESMATLQSRPSTRDGPSSSRRDAANQMATVSAVQTGEKGNYFTLNDKFGVVKLPAVPNVLRAQDQLTAGLVDSSQRNHALLLSHTTAYIWKYTDAHSLPHTFSFRLPEDESRSYEDAPLPVGSLVTPTANSDEPGLVVVLPVSGRISYWDSVGAAVAEGLLGKKRGLEGRISLMSGEHVTAITSVEPAGFLLSLSSGRVVHLTLTTSSGAPDIQVVFMRGHAGLLGGLFGALKPGSFRREIVAIRAGAMLGGAEREAIVATARGSFHRWKIYRNGGEKLLADVDLRDQLIHAIRQATPRAAHRNSDTFVVLDVAVGKYADSESGSADDSTLSCLVLAAFLPSPTYDDDDAVYALVDTSFVAGGRAEVHRAIPISCYSTPNEPSRTNRPRVFLPKPRNTAFVVLMRAVIIVSLLRPPQLGDSDGDILVDEEEEEAPATLFEDVVDFRGDLNVEIIGCGMEDAYLGDAKKPRLNVSLGASMTQMESSVSRNPSVILLAKGASAVVKVEAYDAISEAKVIKRTPVVERIKSKLEQAVFFGDRDQNPLSFENRREIRYPIEEVEKAALTLSAEILSSSSQFVPTNLPQIDSQIVLRSKRLRSLAEHLQANYPPLSAATRWQLCADAEKLEAGRAVWKFYEARKKEGRSTGLLETMVRIVLQSIKSKCKEPIPDFFIYELSRLPALVAVWKKAIISKNLKDDDSRLRHVEEASQITLDILGKSFEFRVTNAALYGFKDHLNRNGIAGKMKGLKEPATSTPDLLENLNSLYETMISVAKLRVQTESGIDDDTASLIAAMPDIAELLCRTYVERSQWATSQSPDPAARKDKYSQEAATVRDRYEASRGEWVEALNFFGQLENAYEIGERYQDFTTLVQICCKELMRLNSTPEENLEAYDRDALHQAIVGEEKRLERYFEEFGEPFAQKFYEFQVKNGSLKELLNRFQNYKHYLDKFLHSDSKFQRISWIHDIGKDEYAQAGETLITLATRMETSNTNRRIELSIAKLALLAAEGTNPELAPEKAAFIDGELDMSILQSDIRAVLVRPVANAVDHAAGLDLLLANPNIMRRLRNKSQTVNYLRHCLSKLLRGSVLSTREFIEVLTLAVPDSVPGYFDALKILSQYTCTAGYKKSLETLIWRRCFLADEWDKLSVQMGRLDDLAREEKISKTALYKTMALCETEGLFEEGSPFKPLKPSTTLAKESEDGRDDVAGEKVDAKSYGSEDFEDNKLLQKYITAGLDGWWEGSKEWAKNKAREDGGEGDDTMEDIQMEG